MDETKETNTDTVQIQNSERKWIAPNLKVLKVEASSGGLSTNTWEDAVYHS